MTWMVTWERHVEADSDKEDCVVRVDDDWMMRGRKMVVDISEKWLFVSMRGGRPCGNSKVKKSRGGR